MVNTVSPDWVEVPAGSVQRGTPPEELDEIVDRHSDLAVPIEYFLKEAPRATIEGPGFAFSRVPISRAEWDLFASAVGLASAPGGNRDFPIEAKWGEAVVFCEWLSDRLSLTIRLPTEVEWERSARGDDTREFPWGDEWDARAANTAELGVGGYLPVGTLLRGASPFGVLDLAGNTDEWTADVYAPYDGASERVPITESWAEDEHVTRGGGYYQNRDLARCARRHGLYEGHTGAGFRVVLEV